MYRRKIILPMRATEMAKNIFVKGDFKKLRAALRQYKKDRKKLAKNLDAFNKRNLIFRDTKWTADDQTTFLQEKNSLIKSKVALEAEKKRLADLSLSLDKQKSEFEELCNPPPPLPESIKKI